MDEKGEKVRLTLMDVDDSLEWVCETLSHVAEDMVRGTESYRLTSMAFTNIRCAIRSLALARFNLDDKEVLGCVAEDASKEKEKEETE